MIKETTLTYSTSVSTASDYYNRCKEIVQFYLDNIPYLSLYTVNSDTGSVYDCVLKSNAGDNDCLALRFYNSGAAFYFMYGYLSSAGTYTNVSNTNIAISGTLNFKIRNLNDALFIFLRDYVSAPSAQMEVFALMKSLHLGEKVLMLGWGLSSSSTVLPTVFYRKTANSSPTSCSVAALSNTSSRNKPDINEACEYSFMFPSLTFDSTDKTTGLGYVTLDGSPIYGVSHYPGTPYMEYYMDDKHLFHLVDELAIFLE